MTTREARGIAAADSEEETIAGYLQRHPEFFERHQALLARLKLPHARGGSTISLVARANDAISERLHRFTRRLLRLVPRAEALTRIEAGLREDFDAFHAALVLIGVPSDPAAAPFVRTVPADDPNLKSFESL